MGERNESSTSEEQRDSGEKREESVGCWRSELYIESKSELGKRERERGRERGREIAMRESE
eukprot:977394-Amorphochlora_amoeboformis.AAC.1